MIEKQVLAFHMTVSRGRGLEHAETSTIDASTVAGFRLSPDVLEFRLEELKIPPLLKTRLRFELGIQTVADFVDRFDTPDLGQMGFGDRVINQVWNQVSKLARSGVEIYLR